MVIYTQIKEITCTAGATGRKGYTMATMKITEAMKTYRLPNPTTQEDLECRWSKVLTLGDKIILAGYQYNGMKRPCYFGATYEFLTDDHTCEGAIGLRAASTVEFEDDGHAMLWAAQQ